MSATDSKHSVRRRSPADYFARLPYWLLTALLLGVLLLWSLLADADYNLILNAVSRGAGVTVYVCVLAYTLALLTGLVLGLARVSRNRFIYEAASFYVEIVRGVPMLVILFYIAFVGAPGLAELVQLGRPAAASHRTTRNWKAAGRVQHPAAFLYQPGNPGTGHRLQRVHCGDFPGGDRKCGAGSDGSGAKPGHEPGSGDAPRDLAAGRPAGVAAPGQRLHRHAQRLGAGVGPGRSGHHPTGQGCTPPARFASSKRTMSSPSSTW